MLAAESKVASAEIADSPGTDSNRSWKHLTEPVEPFLHAVTGQLIRQAGEFDPQIVPYAEYALAGNGKHLRPMLVGLAAGSLGKVTDAHVTAAVIIEMVHLATLVHDDVVDEAEIRRGRPTLAANWGNETAVLLGDCLFAQALKLAAGFPTPEVCRAVAMATNTVCAGEILQTRHRRNFQTTRHSYFRIIEMKTSELFKLSCSLAAFLSRAPAEQRAALRQFGAAFGTAYQVYDDCVDLFGSETAAGKSVGTDLANGKLTWPVLLAWEQATAAERAQLEELVQNWRPTALWRVDELLVKYQTFESSLEVINHYLGQARRALRVLPESGGRTGLLELADYLMQQTAVLGV
jgi:octaprenyl-diphosphate synthase